MRLKQNGVKLIYVTYLVDGVATSLTGRKLYCSVGGSTRVECTYLSQGTYPGEAYFTANGTTATGTKGDFPLEWSMTVTATSEDFPIYNVPDEIKRLIVE